MFVWGLTFVCTKVLLEYMTPLDAWAVAFGVIIGWGCFVMPGNSFLPAAGPIGTFIGLFLAVMTFLKQANLQGKNVYAFFSHEGSSDGAGSLPTLEKLMQAKGAAFDKKTALSVRGSKVKDFETVVRNWVKALSK